MVARWVHPAPCPHPAGKAAVDARRCADVAQDGADSLVERRVVVVVDLPPAEPLLDLSCSPWRCDTGALEGQQDRQAPAQEMVPAGSTDRADHPYVGVALASPDWPARVCRRRVARVHQVGGFLGADEVIEEAGGLVPGFALPAPRGTGQDPVAGLAAVSAPDAAAAAAEGDGVSRAAAALADFGAERPGSGDDPANALAGAVGGLANRLDQQPSVGAPTWRPGRLGCVDRAGGGRARADAPGAPGSLLQNPWSAGFSYPRQRERTVSGVGRSVRRIRIAAVTGAGEPETRGLKGPLGPPGRL